MRQPVEETQESSGTAAEVDQSTGEAAAADEPAGPVAEADAEPVAVQPAAAEPVKTPVSVDVVDAAATPAEVLSPYDSPHDQTGADVSVSAGRGAVWSPDSGDMPPSIVPKSPSAASSEPQQGAVVAEAAASTDPAASQGDRACRGLHRAGGGGRVPRPPSPSPRPRPRRRQIRRLKESVPRVVGVLSRRLRRRCRGLPAGLGRHRLVDHPAHRLGDQCLRRRMSPV